MATVDAPALRNCQAEPNKDLGAWNDICLSEDGEDLVLRRGEALFSMSAANPAELKKLATAPALKGTRIVAIASSGERLWLFLHSSAAAPFALDARSGHLSSFDIPGLTIPGSQAPGIQSCLLIPHADAALLMIWGGDTATWPRKGNRPVYFWMNLKSGKVVAFPVGWDLGYLSANQEVAVFGTKSMALPPIPMQAVNMRNGELAAEIPDERKAPVVPFNWTWSATPWGNVYSSASSEGRDSHIQPVYVRRANKGNRLTGMSLNGSVIPIEVGLAGDFYSSAAKARGGFLGFRLGREGAVPGEPSPFWIMPLKEKESAQLAGTSVTAFSMLDKGNAVVVTGGNGRKGAFSEAFFCSSSAKTKWNVFDGVERLPELDKEFLDKDYIEDRMTVRLVEGLGKHDSLTLCLFSHLRGDMRAFVAKPEEGKIVKFTTWRRAVIVSSDGERYMTDLFREGDPPDRIWLHNSGNVILCHQRGSAATEAEVQLTAIRLRMKP